jgi:isopenicillin-N N-acyltransferase-like protein
MSIHYPLFEVTGTPRALGQQHGEQCRQQLRAFLDYIANWLKLSSAQMQERAVRFLPLFERHCPHLVEEIHGLAEGARVSFAEALAVQVRGEIGPLADGGCTTFVIAARGTAQRQILIGQNSDMDPEFEAVGYMLRLRPIGKPALLMWTFGGQLGYHGINDAGVAHFANALGGGPVWRFALSHYPVKRMMLECRTLDEILDLLRRVPVCSSGNYVVCDGSGLIADIELTPEGFFLTREPADGFISHTNHFLCAPHACPGNHEASVRDSFPRLERMNKLLSGKFGSLSVRALRTFLADHEGHPTSICRHPHDGPDHPSVSARGQTAAALIAEPAEGRLHVSRGNPCQAEFATYQLS